MGDYELGDAGLANQVYVRSIYEEQKVPILRAPMALKGKAAGQDLAWVAQTPPSLKSQKDEMLSLPMFPELTKAQIEYVAQTVKEFMNKK
jgi:dTDP-4-amino-4,6-dideoxygalactose transaminase